MIKAGHNTKPTFVDLFSGAGLFSHAFKESGFDPIAAFDLDRKAIESYNRNVLPVAEVRDVSNPEIGLKPDVIIAGPPCQGFSTLGRRDPKDVRNQLSLKIVDWAFNLQPSAIVVENVPKFVKSATFRTLTRKLRSMGFSIETHTLQATDYGASQRRERVITIASRIGRIGKPPGGLFASTAGDVLLSRPIERDDPMHIWPVPSQLAEARFKMIPKGGDKRDLLRNAPELCPPSWIKLGCHATDVWGRIDPGRPSNTIRCTFQNPSKGRYIHPTEDRVLSLREGARLQGLPDNWCFSGEPYPIARQIGNGVPLALGQAVAKQLLNALNLHRASEEIAA